MIFNAIASVLGVAVQGWSQRRNLRAEADMEIEKLKAQASVEKAKSMTQADITWDLLQAEASASSWKDEWWTIILSLPLLLMFVPYDPIQLAMTEGFKRMEAAPSWYVTAVGVAIAAAFGYRRIVDLMSFRRKLS